MRTLREFAERVVLGDRLEEKLAPPPRDLPDLEPGAGAPPRAPGRPPGCAIVPGREAKVPPLEGWADLDQRRRIIHSLANHELQATELFAWALLAFPDAPPDLRQDLLAVLREEQVHTRLYLRRLENLGVRFGDFPVSGLFWRRAAESRRPVEFFCAMSLTFENANLDHAPAIARVAREHGDEETARLLDRIAADEIGHVEIGRRWLERFSAPGESLWQSYRKHLPWPLHPGRARGAVFHPQPRRDAGLDDEFIEGLADAPRRAPVVPDREGTS